MLLKYWICVIVLPIELFHCAIGTKNNQLNQVKKTEVLTPLSDMQNKEYERGWKTLQEIDGEAGERVIAGLKDVSPDLGRYIIEFVFGDVYPRQGLDIKSKEIAVVAALAALGNATPQLKVHLHGALNVGCSVCEVKEIILQMAVYAGFPAAINAMNAFKEVLHDRPGPGMKNEDTAKTRATVNTLPANNRDSGIHALAALDPEQHERLWANFAGVAPDLVDMIVQFAYGEIISRPGLDLKHRQIATIAALTALGTAPVQLKFHIAGGLRIGLTEANIRETMILMSVYAGFPAAINGTMTLKDVLSEKKAANKKSE